MKSILASVFKVIVEALIPRVVKWLTDFAKRQKINEEVDQETLAVTEVLKKADKYFKENPNAKKLPPNLEAELRRVGRSRANGL